MSLVSQQGVINILPITLKCFKMREYVPVSLRKSYLDAMLSVEVVDRLYFRFSHISCLEQANVLVYDGRRWSCLYEGYHFLAYNEDGCRFLCGKAVFFTDGEVCIVAQEKWYDDVCFTDEERERYIRSQYYEVLNPSNELYMPAYDMVCSGSESFHLSVLFPVLMKQGKLLFRPLKKQRDYVLNIGNCVYIFNLYLIRKQSVLKIWNQWKLYKNRKQVLLQP